MTESKEAEMFYEIRRDRAVPGRGADLARWMDEVVIPIHVEAGMDVVGSFVDRDDEESFVWIRRFASDEERERVVNAAHAHPRFGSEIESAASHLLVGEAAETKRLVPTPGSAL